MTRAPTGLDDVVVVEHQHQLVRFGGQLVDEPGDDPSNDATATSRATGRPRVTAPAAPIQRGGDIAPESDRVVVTLVQ